ncbi:MAG: prolyl oligopeptidase family serine peptidase [Bacteroidota bacterium]
MRRIFMLLTVILGTVVFISFRPGSPPSTITLNPVDYTKTPIYKKISNKKGLKPEYKYLDSVDIFSITHLSDSLKITGFMVQPKKPGKYPCIIYNRGGNRSYGQLLVGTAVQVMAPMAAKGYIVIATNYRGADYCDGKDEFGGSDVNDVINLMHSLAEVPMADTSRIGMFGVSRGGMMTYLSLTKTSKIKAAVVSAGIADAFLNSSNPDHPDMITVYEELVPGFRQNKDSVLKIRSATWMAEKMCPTTPLLILHGTADKRVSVKEAEKLAQKLKELNRNFEFITYEGDDHGLNKNKEAAFAKTLGWFDKYLKN